MAVDIHQHLWSESVLGELARRRPPELSTMALGGLLDRGFCGLVPPAGALRTRAGVERCQPLLALLERRDGPSSSTPAPTHGNRRSERRTTHRGGPR